jgi:hypothetical protein
MATYRYYSVGHRYPTLRSTEPESDKIVILGWSRDRDRAMRVRGTVAVYHASSRKMAAGMARRDRGFDIDWRKF